MFSTVLVANRGEIALRVIRTLRTLGIGSVAVYSDADASAPHVRAADVAVRLGPAAATESYLCIDKIIDAAVATGADAIHPGYGFLSENTAFALACEKAGITFVGPPSTAIEAMGDKIRAKQTVVAAGVPVVPGSSETGLDDDELADAVEKVGLPVLLKPSAGGGGKGMREVHDLADLRDAIGSARREARNSFGDDTLLVERLVTTPRHIEIQVMADRHGNVIHLGERECSLQRRHQKVVEEAPSPLLTPEQREAMGTAACNAARACGYVGAGTVEFIVAGDNPADWFFMEMNTRLQVEHPVTEEVTGLDLVELQLAVAAGLPLPVEQGDVTLTGHAVEVRVYAEDPAAGFLPTGGRILSLHEPTGVRVDSGVAEGGTVGSDYDPMLSKIIAHGSDRAEAIRRLDAALSQTVLLGLDTNIAFLRKLLADPDVRSGALDTGLIGRRMDDLVAQDLPADVIGFAVGLAMAELEPADTGPVDPFDVPGAWRVGEHAWTTRTLTVSGHEPVVVRYRGRAADAEVAIADRPVVRTSTQRGDRDRWLHSQDGRSRTYYAARSVDGVLWIGRDGQSWSIREQEALGGAADDVTAGAGPVLSPMPGTVTVVDVSDGDQVTAGQRLVVVEAMKMEHTLTAPTDGVIRELRARVGGSVAKDAALLIIEEN